MITGKCAKEVSLGREFEVWKPALATIINEVKVETKEDHVIKENFKEMGTMYETDIEKIEWKGCKIEAKTIRDKESHSLVYIAYLDKAILSTPTFQDIDFVISENFDGPTEIWMHHYHHCCTKQRRETKRQGCT